MVTSEKKYIFRLSISRQQYLGYYRGTVRNVQVLSECGQSIRFPAHRLRSFLTDSGVNGRFTLTVDQDNRFVRMEEIERNTLD